MAGTSKEKSVLIGTSAKDKSLRMGRDVTDVTEAVNMFAMDLYSAVKEGSENIVVSPIGLQILLAIAQQGAKGDTSSEILKVLYQKESNKDAICDYKTLIKGLESKYLKLATRIFVEKTCEVSPDFQKITSSCFLAKAYLLDFKSDKSGAVKEINDWAAQSTNNKIKDLIREDSVQDDTVLILANAIHFKAKWENQFDVNNTSDQPFYVSSSKSVNVPMMSLREVKLDYAESEKLKATIVRLPYVGNEFSMIIILPKERDGLAEVESELLTANLIEELSALDNMEVNLMLPRFKIENNLKLNHALSEMGMPTAFSPNAEFSGISKMPLHISEVVQKAFIEVNEEGTEAAAATGLIFRNQCLKICPTVRCDHAFLYLVLKNKDIFFLGRVSDPSKL